LSCFKVDTMFGFVGLVLCFVPFNPHLYLQYSTYNNVV
jgi:hypothetical protein